MELADDAKRAVQELGDAINEAIEKSPRVIEAFERIRRAGFEPNIAVKLNIGLLPVAAEDTDDSEFSRETDLELELTDDDLRELRKMKINLD